jgi:hypothetical protein
MSNSGGLMKSWSRKGETFIPSKPRVFYGGRISNIGTAGNLDLAPDGKRFVVLMPAESSESQETQSRLTLVVNFFDEVRRRVAGQVK